ncbi:MAG: HAD family hydrolase [Sedimentisphaerales bacterium]|nr:HAD family hydrolase [Sedimentisphaerales bacterium]
MAIEAVIFDLDDTLYPEVQYVRSGFRAVASKLAGPDHSTNDVFDIMWRLFETGPRNRIFNETLRQLGQADNPQFIAELVAAYRCHRPSLTLEPEMKQLLIDLKSPYKLGILTDGYLPAQQLKVEALDIARFFDAIIYTEELGREYWKPSPRAFELMAEQLHCRPNECVYVADNPAKDFIAPNRLGWQTIQIVRSDGVHHGRLFAEGEIPDKTVDAISSLRELLLTPDFP